MAKKKRYYGSKRKNGSDMIRANKNAMANLPQEVIMRHYSDYEYGAQREYNDSRAAIDMQMSHDARMLRKSKPKSRY